MLQHMAGGPGAQTCSRRSYDQRPWRPFLLLSFYCMKTAGYGPECMGEIMYGATNVGSLMRRSIHTFTPEPLPLLDPARPPGLSPFFPIQCQPVESVRQITTKQQRHHYDSP